MIDVVNIMDASSIYQLVREVDNILDAISVSRISSQYIGLLCRLVREVGNILAAIYQLVREVGNILGCYIS